MSNVARLHHVLLISQDINKALTGLDSAIAKAIDAAKAAGLPLLISPAWVRPAADQHNGRAVAVKREC